LEFDLAVIFVEISDIHPDRMGALGLAFMDEERNFRYAGKAGTGFSNKDRYDWLEYGKEREVRKEDNKIFIKPDRVVKVEAMDVFIREAETYDQDLNYIGDKTSGILRQPVFIEIREDKEVIPEDIRIEQIPNWNKLIKSSSFNFERFFIESVLSDKAFKAILEDFRRKEEKAGRIFDPNVATIYIKRWDEYRNKPNSKLKSNISEYKSLEELKRDTENLKTKEEINLEYKEKASKGIELVKDYGKFKLYKATNPQGLSTLAQGSRWCVQNVSTAKSYLDRNKFFWIIYKNDLPFIAIPSNPDEGVWYRTDANMEKGETYSQLPIDIIRDDYEFVLRMMKEQGREIYPD